MASERVRTGLSLLAMCFASTATGSLLPTRVDRAISERVSAGEYPAIVVGFVANTKAEVHLYGKLDNGRVPSANTSFEIGSITKTFTASLLADAVLLGKVKLETPVRELLSGFQIPSRDGKQITLVDIATQHSGLPRLPSNIAANNSNPYAKYNVDLLKEFLAGYVLPRDPGDSYEYSNLGYGLLGYALAQQAHTNYGALLQQRIFEPLGMTESAVTSTEPMRHQLARGHDSDGKVTDNWDFDVLAGCGGIRSSLADMITYLKANMGLASLALSDTFRMAQEPRRDIGPDRIGLAWMTRHTSNGDLVWHNGMTGGYASFLGFNTATHTGVVILTNIQESVDDLGFASLDDAAPIAAAHKEVALNIASLDDYVGIYKLREGFLLNISRIGDSLYGQATGQGAFPIFPSAKDEFFAKLAPISISFERGSDGKVAKLVLHQNGDHDAPKIEATNTISIPPRAIQMQAEVLRDYIGRYKLESGALFEITLTDSQLFAQLTGQSAYPVYASAKDKFFYTVVDAQLDFDRDEHGEVRALVLHQNGQVMRAVRVYP